MADSIRVEVVYATREKVFRNTLCLPDGATLAEALEASGARGKWVDADALEQNVGVFGRRMAPDQVLHDGDRVEIYRPLTIDPMEARRRRADHAR